MSDSNVAEHPPITGLILAGGQSKRFGSDKASAPLAGRPMLQWPAAALAKVCRSLVVVRARGQELPAIEVDVPVAVVEDRYEAKGPLAGLVTGFPAVPTDYCFATSCDAPLIEPALVALLARLAEGHDIACPYVGGYLEPLTAVYRVAGCLPAFERAVERDILKITAAWGGLDVVVVREPDIVTVDPGLLSFRNANRAELLAEIEAILAGRGDWRSA